MKLIVVRKEVWIQPVAIEADTTEKALHKVKDGEGEDIEDQFEYSYTLDSEDWSVCDDPRKETVDKNDVHKNYDYE